MVALDRCHMTARKFLPSILSGDPPISAAFADQKHQTVMIVTGVASDWEYFNLHKSSNDNLLSMEGSMIDAVVNVAIFATLGLCIVGFGAWAHKRVDARQRR
jgi:hypothetical protein